MQHKLVSHHVGARTGSIGLPILPKFEKDIINVMYDADADAITQIRRLWSERACDTRVYPYCLAKVTGEAAININFDAFTSSLLPGNPALANYYMFHAPDGVDCVLGEVCRTMEQRTVRTVGLDDLLRSPELADAPPDFLSLDTQGTEHEILEGGRETLRRHVLAVGCEAELVPVYQGQKLFCDLVALMRDAGFRLAQCHLHEGFAPRGAPTGARAKGQPFGTDLLFLREIDSVAAVIADPAERHLALHKLAFISVLFEMLEHGLHVLEAARRIEISAAARRQFETLSYYGFLGGLGDIVAAMPQRRPPTYAEAKSFAWMQARFSS